MKPTIKIFLLFILTFALLSLSGCVSISPEGDGLVMGESYRLESGETLDRDLTVIGGNATIEEGATVNGDVAVIGGNVIIDGNVEGDISVLGGYVELDDNAVVSGDLSTLGGTVRRSSRAEVLGDETDPDPRVPIMRTPNMQISFDPIVGPLTAFFQAIGLAALAIVLHLFGARFMERTGQTAIAQPVASGGVGLLTLLVAPALLLIMGITIILLPLSLLGLLGLGIAALFGWLSLGLMLGRQMNFWLKQTWSDAISAGVGTLTLSLLSSMLTVIPCIGWLVNAIIWFIALGAVVLTRFGTQPYPSAPPVYRAPVPTSPVPVTVVENAPRGGARVYNIPAEDKSPVNRSDDAA